MSSTTIKTTITSLPDLCLLMVFDSVPLMELINVLLTCPRWNSLRSSIFARRTRLRLATGRLFKSESNDLDRLAWSALTPKLVALLSNSFKAANIRELDYLHISRVAEKEFSMTVNNFSVLLNTWALESNKPIHTISLHVYDPLTYPLATEQWSDHLLGAIGSFRSLRVLDIPFAILKPYIENQTAFPVLGQLHRLETAPSTSADLVSFCQWLGVKQHKHLNDRLEIVFPSHWMPDICLAQMELIFESGVPLHQFTGNFPELEEEDCTFDQLHRFLGHLSGLTEFVHNPSKLSLAELSRALSQLPHLQMLSLTKFPWTREGDQLHLYHSLPSVYKLEITVDDTDLGLAGYDSDDEEFQGDQEEEKKKIQDYDATHFQAYVTVFTGLQQLIIDYDGDKTKTRKGWEVIARRIVLRVVRPYLRCGALTELILGSQCYRLSPHSPCTPEQLVAMLLNGDD